MPVAKQAHLRTVLSRLRLMVSGSAALPTPTLEAWRRVSTHTLLERYGMTETGMILSNPYAPASARVPGAVGRPLPGVTVRLAPAEPGAAAAAATDGAELWVRGPTVFSEYWQKPEATAAAFTDGWFRTGDIAVATVDATPGAPPGLLYRLLGRASADIIKTSGFKVSALEIERELLAHPQLDECAVVGVPDPTGVTGEDVCLVAVLRPVDVRAVATPASPPPPLTLPALAAWAKAHLAPYKLPKRWLVVDAIPKNAMGKVNKKELRKLFDPVGTR